MIITLYHAAPLQKRTSILAEGLRYGSSGPGNQEPHARAANSYLDRHRPSHLARLGVCRTKQQYAFAGIGDALWDVQSGALRPVVDWDPGVGMARFALRIDSSIAWVSDLDCYDKLAAACMAHAPDEALRNHAAAYWQRLIPWDVLQQQYTWQQDGYHKQQTAPHHLPRRYKRIEIVLTASVPPAQITSF
jgi:hypothetical protein